MQRTTRVVSLAAAVAIVATFATTGTGTAAVPRSTATATSTATSTPTSARTTTPAAAERAPSGPWDSSSYRPHRGGWRDYVLAPKTRTVVPTGVVSADARGGSIEGDPSAALAKDGNSVRLTSTGGRSSSPLMVMDFGKEVSGTPRLRITGASDPRPDLHVCFSESKKYMALDPTQNNGESAHAPGCDTANIWNGFPGTPYTYDSDSHTLPWGSAKLPATITDPQLRGAFRYATVFLDGPGYVDLDAVDMKFTAAPAQQDLRDYAGHFLSSDNLLNKIWYAGAYTVQIDTDRSDTAKSWPYADGEADHADDQVPGVAPGKEVIFDGGKRDRIVWQGDLAVQGPVTYLTTHDLGAVTNSLSSLAGQQLSDGYMPAESLVGPHNEGEMRTYGEYVTWFVNNMSAHYLYTGDQAYLQKWYPALVRATAWLESVRQQDDEGLIGFGAVGSCGHYGYGDCGHETYVNALYVRNLHQMSTMAKAVGRSAAATTYRKRAVEVAGQINAQLWDDATGAYRLSREIPKAYPQDANATAVLTGVASNRRAKRAMAYLHDSSWAKLGALTVSPSTPNASISPFYAPLPSGFEVDARLALNDPTQVRQQSGVQLMKTFWGWMLRQDPGSTFWEHVQPDGTPNLQQFSSLAHGWATGPTISLTQGVLGVTPTGPGYSTYDVAPHPDALRWAEGRVPTGHGAIDASWQHPKSGAFNMSVTAPKGTSGTVKVPTFGDRVKVTVDGRTVWNGTKGSADLKSGYVVVGNVKPGHHSVRSVPISRSSSAEVSITPSAVATRAGSTEQLSVTVAGRAAHRLTGSVAFSLPAGWTATPSSIDVSLTSDGRPVSRTYDVAVHLPASAAAGAEKVTARFTGSGVTSQDATAFTVSDNSTLYDFESGTQGWVAGANVSSVSKVGSFANGPGKPQDGSGALDAESAGAPADAFRSVSVEPGSAIDLSSASTLTAHVDGYGGMPGATGYEAKVTLTGAGGEELTKTFPVTPDSWNALGLDVSGWAARSALSRIEIGFRAVGTSAQWQPHFQVDSLTTS
jgi:hypothetical protein